MCFFILVMKALPSEDHAKSGSPEKSVVRENTAGYDLTSESVSLSNHAQRLDMISAGVIS